MTASNPNALTIYAIDPLWEAIARSGGESHPGEAQRLLAETLVARSAQNIWDKTTDPQRGLRSGFKLFTRIVAKFRDGFDLVFKSTSTV